MLVCAAAVLTTLEPYYDSCGGRVTANLLIGQNEAEEWRSGETENVKEKQRERERERGIVCPHASYYVSLQARCMWVCVYTVCPCIVCVCRADFQPR